MVQGLRNETSEGRFDGVGGFRIFYRSWRPYGGARGIAVLVHGFNSHSGYYTWIASQLAATGLAVYALDHRGRGRSEGERYYVETVDDYVTDLATFVQLATSENPGLPVFMLGHSAGGVISCVYALEHQDQLAGLICESFAFKVPAPDFALSILKGLSHIAPHAHVFKLKNADFSRDPDVVQYMNADPLIHNEVQPTQTVAAMVRADERLERELGSITIPLFIIHGTHDRATRPSGSQQFYDTAGSSDKTLKLYEGYVHDLLNDLGREAVMADIERWIDARVTTAGADRADLVEVVVTQRW
ncbi:MAG TPA: lysophospholipase [Vicinamibacterales bacterium]|nr:lysophospholipase [Vicinamibacterales bacterium]